MPRSSLVPSLALVLGLAVGLTGCGDDADDTAKPEATAAKGLSAADLRSKADAICARTTEDTSAIGSPESLADVAEFAPKVLAISEQGVKDLEALVPSEDDAETMSSLIGLVKESNSQLEGVVTAAEAEDEDAVTAGLDASSAKLDEFATEAKAAGFDDCGEGSSASDESTDDTTDDTTGDDTAAESPFDEIDLGTALEPIAGYEYVTLIDEARAALTGELAKSTEVTELVSAVGTTTVTDGTDNALLIFLGLKSELTPEESAELVSGVTEGSSGITEGDVAGQPGTSYVSPDGQQGFVAVRADTVVIALSDSVDHLKAVVTGLFEANPTL